MSTGALDFHVAWAMPPLALERLIDQAATFTAGAGSVASARASAPPAGVAVLPVQGPLLRTPSPLAEWLGATTYEALGAQLAGAAADAAVHAIILDVDSGGGELSGLTDVAAQIRAIAESKPVIAHVSGEALSAAYWLASASSEVVASETAVLGSIGIMATMHDTRERDARAGVRRITIVSSQTPKKGLHPGDDAGRAEMQTAIDALGRVFLASVTSYRGASEAAVRASYGTGGVYVGAQARAIGLADRVDTLAGTLARARRHAQLKADAVAAAHRRVETARAAAEEARLAPIREADAARELAARITATYELNVVRPHHRRS